MSKTMRKEYTKPALAVENISTELPISMSMNVSNDPDNTIDGEIDFLSKDAFDDWNGIW